MRSPCFLSATKVVRTVKSCYVITHVMLFCRQRHPGSEQWTIDEGCWFNCSKVVKRHQQSLWSLLLRCQPKKTQLPPKRIRTIRRIRRIRRAPRAAKSVSGDQVRKRSWERSNHISPYPLYTHFASTRVKTVTRSGNRRSCASHIIVLSSVCPELRCAGSLHVQESVRQTSSSWIARKSQKLLSVKCVHGKTLTRGSWKRGRFSHHSVGVESMSQV